MAVTYAGNADGPMPGFIKDPDAVVDFLFDWSSYLESGETISSYTATASGLTVDSDAATGTAVTVWVSGGTDGANATVTVQVVTSSARTDERTILIKVRER